MTKVHIFTPSSRMKKKKNQGKYTYQARNRNNNLGYLRVGLRPTCKQRGYTALFISIILFFVLCTGCADNAPSEQVNDNVDSAEQIATYNVET